MSKESGLKRLSWPRSHDPLEWNQSPIEYACFSSLEKSREERKEEGGDYTRCAVEGYNCPSPGACLWGVSFLCGPGSSRENPHHPGSLSLCINFTEPQHQPLPFSPSIIGVSFSCWVGGAARGIWGRTAVCSELSLHFLWGLDTSKPYAFPVSRPCSVWALEAQDGPRFTPPHLELTSPATQVYGDWDDPARQGSSPRG